MKYFLLKIFTFGYKILTSPLMLFKVTNKITLISRKNNKKSMDLFILEKDLKKMYPNYKVIVLTDYVPNDFLSKVKYALKTFTYLHHIYSSKILICDYYIPFISLTYKKKETKIIQMWHAAGAYKKYGYSILGKIEGENNELVDALKIHNNYDYFLVSGSNIKSYYEEAFDVDEAKLVLGLLPHFYYLKANEQFIKKELLDIYPKLNNDKQNILYAPTFRQSNRSYFDDVIENVDYTKYNLIIKKHSGEEEVYIDHQLIYTNYHKDVTLFLCLCDYLITDYSSIVFEAMYLNKKIYFYTKDYNAYKMERNFYDPICDLLGTKYLDIKELLSNLNLNINDKEKYEAIKRKHLNSTYNDFLRILGDGFYE